MFRRGRILLPSRPAITLITASIICHVIRSAGAQPSAAFPVLVLLPDDAKDLSRDWDQALSASSPSQNGVAVSTVTVRNGSGDVLSSLCHAVQQHQPALLLSFLNLQESLFAQILSESTSTPLLSATQEYGSAGFMRHYPQVRALRQEEVKEGRLWTFQLFVPSVT